MLTIGAGCGDWLDVEPRTELKGSIIYKSEEGFKDVMNGIYIQMAGPELYGVNTSFYFTDLLANLWYVRTSQNQKIIDIAAYKYTNKAVEEEITAIWSKYYTVIAHINDLLENLAGSNVSFNYGNKELLLGEAYGLRAFLHLEVLRLFGPVPSLAADGDLAVPYVTELTRDPSRLISVSYGEVKKRIEADLDQAEKYLKDDPFQAGTMSDVASPNYGNYTPNDSWHYYRQTHFNMYAVDAVRARFYQWIGNTDKAVACARKVVEARNPDDAGVKFVLANEANSYAESTTGNLVYKCEHIFALTCSNHQDMIQNMFVADVTVGATLYLRSTWPGTIYENDQSDVRNKANRYCEIDGQTAYFLKYNGNDVIRPANQIPLLRLAEMYLILIEDLPWSTARTISTLSVRPVA